MALIDPLKGVALPKARQLGALVDPLRPETTAGAREPTVANYELGNMDVCPDCGEPMEQLLANDVLSNVCIKHRVALPVKDKAPE